MKLRVVFGEALRSLGASMSTTVAATLTVLIGMFVLGLTIALGTWVLAWSDHAKRQLLDKVYFCTVRHHQCERDVKPKAGRRRAADGSRRTTASRRSASSLPTKRSRK